MKLSVLLPNYNHAKYIGEAIEAILSQSYKPMELIIIDDASTDNSVEVIQKFTKNKVIRFIRNERNIGVMGTINKFLNLSRGDYVYVGAADDRVLPGFFEKSMRMLTKYPNAGLCCADAAGISNEGIIKRTIDIAHCSRYYLPNMVAEMIRNMPFYIEGRTAITKRKLFMENGGLILDLKMHSDWLLWLLVAFRHGICYIPETLTAFRVLPTSYFANEFKDKASNCKATKCLLFTLKTPLYIDILPLFRYSCALNQIGAVGIVLSNPKLWDYLSVALLRKSLSHHTLRKLSPLTPAFVKSIYQDIRNRNTKCKTKRIYETQR